MAIPFHKYQGTGNDFIIIDNRNQIFNKNNTSQIALMCDRRFGIGADGLILLENSDDSDFRMVYFNADGQESSMCGNGGRCMAHYANLLGISEGRVSFTAIDGRHEAHYSKKEISLLMGDVEEVMVKADYVFLDTGSPHHVTMVEELDKFDVFSEGRRIREKLYGREGANINFVSQVNDYTFRVRTYERGVENETLSCGTGVTAVAIAMHATGKSTSEEISLLTPGGTLKVKFKKKGAGYSDIYLTGPAQLVYQGVWKQTD